VQQSVSRMSRCTGVLFVWMISINLCALDAPASTPARRQEETAEMFVERVKKAIENDEWSRARAGLKHALALNPNLVEAYFLSARVYEHDGDLQLASLSLEEVIRLQPQYPEAHLLLAQYLFRRGKGERAKEEANIALAQGASRFEGYRLLGDIEFGNSHFENAVTQFEKALAEKAEDDEAARHLRDRINGAKRLIAIGVAQDSAVDVRPMPLNSSQPRYTEQARKEKIQGYVLMAVLVTEKGEVADVEIISGLGYGLDEAAADAARALKYSPAQKNGQPVACWARVQVGFNLR
jgi:TonB family protein